MFFLKPYYKTLTKVLFIVGGDGSLKFTASSNLSPGCPYFPGAYAHMGYKGSE